MQIHAYFTFNGNCREAMTFYQQCLGGQLTFRTLGSSPLSEKMPQAMKDCILEAMLTLDGGILTGTDMTPESGLVKGNAVSLLLNCKSEKEAKQVFTRLSKGGKVHHPLELNAFGMLLGDLTDKYSNNWILNFNKHSQPTKI